MVCALLLLPLLVAQDPDPLDPEGPLGNDTFLPSTPAAQEALRRGDAAWQRARAAAPDWVQQRTLAFDAWRAALIDSVTGDVVRLLDEASEARDLFPDDDRTHHRRVEGVAAAVLRRLGACSADDRRAWTERFDPLAQAALATGPYREDHLERIEREWPLTRAAALAGLRRADLCLEEGRPAAARTWLARARRHVGDDPRFESAHARRRAALDVLVPARLPDAWRSAGSLELVRSLRLESDRVFGRDPRPAPLGRELHPGLAPLPDGGVAVQTPQGLVWIGGEIVRGGAAGLVGRLSLAEFLDLPRLRPFSSPSAGGWPLLPSANGSDLILVVGRGHSGRVVREFQLPARSNHLVCLRPGASGAAELRWHVSDQGLRRADGSTLALEAALAVPGQVEFQPGPVVHEGTLFVQVRGLDDPTAEGEARGGGVYLVALDAATGAHRFTRFLTRAADLRRDLGGRNGASGEVPTSGMPLAIHAGVAVVGTNVGLVCAFDAVDGRWAWGLRTRRRAAEEPGWPGSRAPILADLTRGPAVLVAPFDSDRLYALPVGPAHGATFFLRAPEPMAPMLDVVGGAGDELVFLGNDGRHRALRTRREGESARSALYLGRGEGFGGAALFSVERVIVSSDRAAHLFDRTRGDLLLDAVDLPDMGAGRGGTVIAWRDRVFVVGRDTLWVLAAQ